VFILLYSVAAREHFNIGARHYNDCSWDKADLDGQGLMIPRPTPQHDFVWFAVLFGSLIIDSNLYVYLIAFYFQCNSMCGYLTMDPKF
jgi:hypothetical protein